MVGRVAISTESARGAVFAPIHWSGMNSSNGRVGALVNPSVDPLSGEPEFKLTPVRVEPFMVSWYGCILTRTEPSLREMSWWACAQSGAFRSYEVAGRSVPLRWPAWGRTALMAAAVDADFIDYEDASAGTYRAALLRDERLEAYVCVSRSPEKSARSWLSTIVRREPIVPCAARGAARREARGSRRRCRPDRVRLLRHRAQEHRSGDRTRRARARRVSAVS